MHKILKFQFPTIEKADKASGYIWDLCFHLDGCFLVVKFEVDKEIERHLSYRMETTGGAHPVPLQLFDVHSVGGY